MCDVTLLIFCIPWDPFFSKYIISGVCRWISPKVQLNRYWCILWIFPDYTLNEISKMLKYLMVHSHTIAVYHVPRTCNIWPGKWYTEVICGTNSSERLAKIKRILYTKVCLVTIQNNNDRMGKNLNSCLSPKTKLLTVGQ